MGDETTATTAVETQDAVDASDDTLLTGDASTEQTSTDDGSDAGAAQASAEEGGASTDEGATDAGAEGSQTPPDTYADFVMPEGIELDETALSEATPLFKELGLNQEQAQKLIDVYAAQIQAGSQKQIDNFNQLKSDWREQAKRDNEYGGDKFEENVKTARHAISKFGTPELKQLLNDYGVGNHPEIIRFMVRVGKTLNEDVPGSSGSAASTVKDRVSILYPNER